MRGVFLSMHFPQTFEDPLLSSNLLPSSNTDSRTFCSKGNRFNKASAIKCRDDPKGPVSIIHVPKATLLSWQGAARSIPPVTLAAPQ